MPTNIALLGSTGSVGRQTLDVIERAPDQFKVVCLAAGSNVELLEQQVRVHIPALVVSGKALSASTTAETLPSSPESLIAAATHPDVDLVVFAMSGHDGIAATIAAIEAGKQVAIANKEAIVCAGDIIMPLAAQHGITIRPVDSEHSAIWQSMASGIHDEVRRIVITASGGPFRTTPAEELAHVTVEQAMKHPTWNMGGKITVDSATLVNKGLELIEAHHLFAMPFDQIDIVIHPESIIHSLVEFVDGSTIAQLNQPDMRLPIQYALTWPRHHPGPVASLNLAEIGSLTFEEPDEDRFPALRLARDAGLSGDTYPTVYSAVDEISVEAFAHGRLRFTAIPRLIETVLSRHSATPVTSLDDVLDADQWARREATRLLAEIAAAG
ncbi:MAG: 1-deoxy-D-xylulose-5-phosphate reductoisomerase [Chloroflexia bacterium]|nr:1-deoxy-D-xylulose-5-phosphate reductoisomerase [Chloroflexia bacterium]